MLENIINALDGASLSPQDAETLNKLIATRVTESPLTRAEFEHRQETVCNRFEMGEYDLDHTKRRLDKLEARVKVLEAKGETVAPTGESRTGDPRRDELILKQIDATKRQIERIEAAKRQAADMAEYETADAREAALHGIANRWRENEAFGKALATHDRDGIARYRDTEATIRKQMVWWFTTYHG